MPNIPTASIMFSKQALVVALCAFIRSSAFLQSHGSLVTRRALSLQSLSRPLLRCYSTAQGDEKEDKESKNTGHQVSGSMPQLSAEEQAMIEKFRAHQTAAPLPSMAEEVRTLLEQSLGFGVLAANSLEYEGFPTGHVLQFALDDEGKPFFSMTAMSAQTKDILKDGRVSLTVTAKDFKGPSQGRVMMVGTVKKVFDEERRAQLREKYLARHKESYWVDFGDFSFFQMESIAGLRYIAGFGRAGTVTPEEYYSAKADPIAPFADAVMKHMNEDHGDATNSMVKHYVGLPCKDAQIVSMDRLGLTVKATMEIAGGGAAKVRLPYPREVTGRKEIKEVLVEMTKAAKAGAE